MGTIHITVSLSIHWNPSKSICYIAIESPEETQHHSLTVDGESTYRVVYKALTKAMRALPDGSRIVVQSATHLYISGNVKPSGTNRVEKELLLTATRDKSLHVEWCLIPVEESRRIACPAHIGNEMQLDPASTHPQKREWQPLAIAGYPVQPPGTPDPPVQVQAPPLLPFPRRTSHLAPTNWHAIEIPCPCGKAATASFWKRIRCHQWATVQCSCDRKHEADWLP